MKRFLMVLAIAGLMAGGCKDDDDDDDVVGDGGNPDGGGGPTDGGGIDARVDSGTDSAVLAKVTNAGTICTAASSCQGAAPVCAPATQFGVPAPGGGFCSATCTKAAECGPNGDCPLGELVTNATYGAQFKAGFMTAGLGTVENGQCYAKCTQANSQSTCQTGYVCINLATAFALTPPGSTVAEATRLVCLPAAGLVPRPAGDAGVDGGRSDASVADASGIDSGN